MKKIFFVLQLLICCAYPQLLPEKLDIITNDIYKQYDNVLYFEFVPICDIPSEVFETYHLPFLDQGHIAVVKDVGIIWCSSKIYDSCDIDDSCYVVIKTKLAYNIEWWKRSYYKWLLLRIQHVKN